jgi:hypothetical protein
MKVSTTFMEKIMGRSQASGAEKPPKNQALRPQSVQIPSGPMMPMQLSSGQSLRVVFFFPPVGFLGISFPQWGQNLAQKGMGLWHFSQSSLPMGAPHSLQISSMKTHFYKNKPIRDIAHSLTALIKLTKGTLITFQYEIHLTKK